MLKSKRILKPKAKAKGDHLPKPAALAGKDRNTKNSKLSKQKTQLKHPNSIRQSRGTTTSNRTGYGGGSSEPGDAELQRRPDGQTGRGNLAGKLARAFKLQRLRPCRAARQRGHRELQDWRTGRAFEQ